MKKFQLLIILVISSLQFADAQWYERKCGISDIENCTQEDFRCLWKNASNNVIGGAITTAIGTACVIVGIGLITKENTAPGDIESNVIGVGIVFTSIIMNLIGIPTWLAGANRKAILKTLPHYQTLNSGVLNLSPTINRNQYTNTYSFGLTASLRF